MKLYLISTLQGKAKKNIVKSDNIKVIRNF